MKDIAYLELGIDEDGLPRFRGTTNGCGCCSSDYRMSELSLDQAKELAKDWIAQLEELLGTAKDLASRLDTVSHADWAKATEYK